jgi:hypothetical protein
MSGINRINFASFIVCLMLALAATGARANPPSRVDSSASPSLWVHDNLHAWCVVPFDAKKREPEARARMLQELGFKHFAYDWRPEDVPNFDAEIEALQRRDINLLGWWFPLEADDPLARQILNTFRRHGVRPQLWVNLRSKNPKWPKSQEDWIKLLPPGATKNQEEFDRLSPAEQAAQRESISRTIARLHQQDMPKTPKEHQRRVAQEADRIRALVQLARPYGVKVALYNHNGWFGLMDNQLAIIEALQQRGITDVGIVYNFSHARDELHDDTVDFPALWRKIQPYVVAVNITGMHSEGNYIYPSQGDSELRMMRTIQDSGWRGPIGLLAEKGGDAESTLRNYRIGLDWLAAELKQPGSGGPRPFPKVR